jgi:hypothetical protein
MNEVRTEIFQALEDIPDKLRRTQVVLQVFQRVEPLHNCSLELYVATLQMLAHIIYWYKSHASSMFPRSYGWRCTDLIPREDSPSNFQSVPI